MADQVQNPGRSFGEWMDDYKVTQNQMQDERVGKGGCCVGEIGGSNRDFKRRRARNATDVLEQFQCWMQDQSSNGDGKIHASEPSIEKYKNGLEMWMQACGLKSIDEAVGIDISKSDFGGVSHAKTAFRHLKAYMEQLSSERFASLSGGPNVVLRGDGGAKYQRLMENAMIDGNLACAAAPGGKGPVANPTAAVACSLCHDGVNWLELGEASRCPRCGLQRRI